MMRTMMFSLCSLMILCTGYVQTRDDFNGGFDPSLRWSWKAPGITPECTLDPTAVSFTDTELAIQMRDGAFYLFYNNIRDVPNLTLTGTPPDDWYIETAFRTDWNQYGVFNYVQAGIVIFTDAANYFQLLITRDATNQTMDVNGSTNIELGDNFNWGERVTNPWLPDDQPIGLKIAHDPNDQMIKLYFRRSTDADWVLFDGCCGNAYDVNNYQYGAIQNMLNTPGARIGVYVDNAGGGYQDPFYFDYFETNLPVAASGDVNGDGCVDDSDLLAVLFAFGNAGDCLDEDLNNDGVVDDADLLSVLFSFGAGC